ncbi:MAG: hypothetical protein AB3N14_01545 [Flavobacteriaceae bacterium]
MSLTNLLLLITSSITIVYILVWGHGKVPIVFPIDKSVNYLNKGSDFSTSTAASVFSFATLLVAIFDLYGIFQLWLLWAVFTSGLGVSLLIPMIKPLLKDVSEMSYFPNLPEYLGHKYNKQFLAKVTSVFSVLSYNAVLGLEVYVFARILNLLVPDIPLLTWIIVFVATVLLVSALGGFRIVVLTDKFQTIALLVFLGISITFLLIKFPPINDSPLLSSTRFPIAQGLTPFLISLLLINLLTYFTDFNIFQKVVSAKSSAINKRSIWASVGLLVLTWTLVIACAAVSYERDPLSYSGFSTFLSQIQASQVVLGFAVVGFVAAALSTATSQFTATSHLTYSLLSKKSKSALPPLLIMLLIMAVAISLLLHLEFTIWDFILAVYGTQLSLVPSFTFAMYAKRSLPEYWAAALCSVVLGYSSGWIFALLTKWHGLSSLTYWTPVISFIVSLLTFYFIVVFTRNPQGGDSLEAS